MNPSDARIEAGALAAQEWFARETFVGSQPVTSTIALSEAVLAAADAVSEPLTPQGRDERIAIAAKAVDEYHYDFLEEWVRDVTLLMSDIRALAAPDAVTQPDDVLIEDGAKAIQRHFLGSWEETSEARRDELRLMAADTFAAIERHRASESAPTPDVRPEWQLCPVCGGTRTVSHGFFTRMTMATSTAPEKCLVCNGTGLVPYPDYGQPDHLSVSESAPIAEQLAEELEIANERGDEWRRLYNLDTTELAAAREQSRQLAEAVRRLRTPGFGKSVDADKEFADRALAAFDASTASPQEPTE